MHSKSSQIAGHEELSAWVQAVVVVHIVFIFQQKKNCMIPLMLIYLDTVTAIHTSIHIDSKPAHVTYPTNICIDAVTTAKGGTENILHLTAMFQK